VLAAKLKKTALAGALQISLVEEIQNLLGARPRITISLASANKVGA
jgi:hypothetical protein